MTAAEDGKPSLLYRCYNAANDLMYVGVTYHISPRKSQHRKNWPWFAQVVRVDAEEYRWRRDALMAELTAIENEKPRHNFMGIKRPMNPETHQDGHIVWWEEDIRKWRGEWYDKSNDHGPGERYIVVDRRRKESRPHRAPDREG